MKKTFLDKIGPGFVIAATGLGAGDLIAATVAGIEFQTALLWAVLLGALLKGALNEALARWQLQTGTTLLEGWMQRLPRWVQYYFVAYLGIWSFLVGAALMAACGLAANALFPQLSVNQWAILHSLLAVLMILYGRYSLFENLMKLFIGLMFITVLLAVINLPLDWQRIAAGLIPNTPDNSLKLILGVIGGVGGSVTLMCYGYWLREKQWDCPDDISSMRVDLWCAYGITALFGVLIILLAASVQPEMAKGTGVLLALAEQLKATLGDEFGLLFLIGFWGAVFSSMLGVWQGVPYLFADFYRQHQGKPVASEPGALDDLNQSKAYYVWLGFMALPPYLLLFYEKPIWLAITYAVAGAFFMPFLAATLLYMNNKIAWINGNKNGFWSNALLITALSLFVVLLIQKLKTTL
ncbi:MAG: Nramp family divalent metal transporter [Candidatus Pelagadaptatus aseana]|uniref:Nramp family divalent metal transporter n=1 Tax=Candidatus Pelagadaptatus aseana TaxID=3120508 RepID=UPI0039B1C9BC